MKVLVTGSAGFIGSALALRLLERNDAVVGVDNLNDYYDVNLKESRLNRLRRFSSFHDARLDIADSGGVDRLFTTEKPDRVVNLAAQAGVRYSAENPHVYVNSNVLGFLNILEGCRHHGTDHFVYASSSSVYGDSSRMPLSVDDRADHPVSLYAATKKSNELMAHAYSHTYGIPATGLRFFTVYGPWGRPDMAMFKFTRNIIDGQPIDVYNHGRHRRDFTYIDDVVEGLIRVLDNPAAPVDSRLREGFDTPESSAPHRIYNIGNNNPIKLEAFITAIENCVNKKAIKNMLPQQPGDVVDTFADVSDLVRDFGYQPKTPVEEGVRRFVDWYIDFYHPERTALAESQR